MESLVINRRPSTQDVSWFVDMYAAGQLDLNPPYQRRSVWGSKDRKFFLDTVFRGFPCPAIYLHKTVEKGKTVYAVVDGKQRIETILQFYNNKISLSDKFNDTRLDGKRWKSIQSDGALAAQFLDYVFPVEFVELPFNDPAYVNDVFDRLNRNSKVLNPQELRHARYSGWLISFVEAEIENRVWQDCKVWTKSKSKRMLDIQFLSELVLLIIMKGPTGFSQERLDVMYALYDDLNDWDDTNEWGMPPLDEDDFKEFFNDLKEKLIGLMEAESSVKSFVSETRNLYTLWSYWVCERTDSQFPQFSEEKYLAFIKSLEQISNVQDPSQLSEMDANAFSYFDANRGATTEAPQRIQRLEALKKAME